MLPIEAIRNVKRIIVHEQRRGVPCPDGRAAALILHEALPDVPILEMAYNSPEHMGLEPAPGYLFCDFSPWAPKDEPARSETLARWASVGTIVLDHHDKAITDAFGALGAFGENAKDESGAWLALREVLAPNPDMPSGYNFAAAHNLARFAAIRDTWQRDSVGWSMACEVSATLCFYSLRNLLKMTPALLLEFAGKIGPTLVETRMSAAREAAKNAVVYTLDGVRFATIPSCELTSDVSDIMGDSVDMVVGFEYVHENDGKMVSLQLSMRSHGRINVTSIAKSLGGGGHDNGRAAGCRTEVIRDGHLLPVGAPYKAIVDALRVAQMWRNLVPSVK
jgi:hypothetical protein